MPKKIDQKDYETPEWFDLSNYEQLEVFNLEDWFVELKIRKNILDDPGSPISKQLQDMIRQYGLVRGAFETEPIGDEEWIAKGLKTNAARLSSCRDVVNLEVDDDLTRLCKNPISFSEEIASNIPYNVFKSESRQLNNILNMTIDLNSPDSVLVSDFQKIINNARGEFGKTASTQVSDIKVESWISEKLIPYIDLYTWALENGVSIDEEVLCVWLYSENDEAAKNRHIERVTHKNALKLLSDDFISNLQSSLFSNKSFSKSKHQLIANFLNRPKASSSKS